MLVQPTYTLLTGTAVHTLMDLSAGAPRPKANGPLSAALERIGDPTGESWLHLLGLCLDLEPPYTLEGLIERVERMDAAEFRLLLLGAGAWSWRSIVGLETIESAAKGDRRAARRLLEDDRYYGGHAKAALSRVVRLDGAETRRRYLQVLVAYRAEVGVEALVEPLRALAATVESLAEDKGWVEAVDLLSGYRYVPEPEARRVVIMPHLAGPGLTLAQHDEARLIAFGQPSHLSVTDRAVELGKALADPTRVDLLSALASGPRHLAELMEMTELTRSTVHHHLRQLRLAGLVAVEGNARAYRYRLDDRGRAEVMGLLSDLLTERMGG